MCGIAGLALRPGQAPDSRVLEALTRALAHRGRQRLRHLVQHALRD